MRARVRVECACGAGSGAISSRELAHALEHGDLARSDLDVQQMVTSLVWTYDAEKRHERSEARRELETAHWSVSGNSVESVREQMRRLLVDSGAAVMDVVKLFDRDADRALQVRSRVRCCETRSMDA